MSFMAIVALTAGPIETRQDEMCSYRMSKEQGARRSGQPAMKRSKQGRYDYENHRPVTG